SGAIECGAEEEPDELPFGKVNWHEAEDSQDRDKSGESGEVKTVEEENAAAERQGVLDNNVELMQEVFAAVEGGPGGVVHLILHFVAGDVGIGGGAEERGGIGLHFGWADIGMCMSAGGAGGEPAEAAGVGGGPGEGEGGEAGRG